MAINDDSKLVEIIAKLKRKPGHENVRATLYDLLVNGLNIDLKSIYLEENLKEIRGRMDAILGRTIIEIKSNLDREVNDAEEQLLKYLQEKEAGGDFYTGIATDGSIFKVYIRKDNKLELINEYTPDIKKPRELLLWLESALALEEKIEPEGIRIEIELGRDSVFYRKSLRIIEELWEELQKQADAESESTTKYKEWKRLLSTAYVEEVDEQDKETGYDLFFQHTYLTFVAKAISSMALFKNLPNKAKDFLSGKDFENDGIYGAIESDFFNWVLLHDDGGKLVLDIAQQVQKFDWGRLKSDVLKVLYESLIDPAQRQVLGEYYTPDWLAEKICRKIIKKPLDMRILDPTCGSGTFLFHAIRLGIEEAKKQKITKSETVSKITENIVGIDIHPVAVIFARVTYILALLPLFEGKNPAKGKFSVPVYLGNSLQWDVTKDANKEDLEIIVPSIEKFKGVQGKSNGRKFLRFPKNIAKEKNLFDNIINQMLRMSDQNRDATDFAKFLRSNKVSEEDDIRVLERTYKDLCILKEQKRNDIWGYVARNLSRPLWLSSESEKADLIVGNPPWQGSSKMGDATIQAQFEKESKRMELWSKGTALSASHELSCYCFARFIELYMKKDGQIAFVMPLSVLTRQPSKKFRTGRFVDGNTGPRYFEFTEAWGMSSKLRNLFKIPSCVIFARNAKKPFEVPPPEKMKYIAGNLPEKNMNLKDAEKFLTETTESWPSEEKIISPYGKNFDKGATFIPRRFVFIERLKGGLRETSSPIVQGKIGRDDKKPWKNITPPKHSVEEEFIHPIYRGESIAPYRVIGPDDGVVPWDEKRDYLMNSLEAVRTGYPNLSEWLMDAETKWEKHKTRKSKDMTFAGRIDYRRGLSRQFPISALRVVYASSGTWPASTILKDEKGLIDSKLYWTEPKSLEEAYYLIAILNSETTRAAAEQWQSEGQFGKRDFSRSMFNLPIPLFDSKVALHKKIATLAKRAEEVASHPQPDEGQDFKKFRTKIREALIEDGVAGEIDKAVGQLLKLKM